MVRVYRVVEGTPTAGASNYFLLCNVARIETLDSDTILEVIWLDASNNTISSADPDFIIRGSGPSTTANLTSTLTINTVRTSHAGIYTCLANMTIPGIVQDHQVSASTTVTVISESSPFTVLSM